MAGWQELKADLLRRVPAVAKGAPHLGMAEPRAQQWIVDQVRAGNYVRPVWWPLLVPLADNVVLTVTIANEPLRLGVAGDSVRPICSARAAAGIADALGCVCPTAKLLDTAGLAGAVVSFQGSDVGDISLAHMVERSEWIDSRSPPTGLLRIADAQWVCSSLLNNAKALQPWGVRSAINYGKFTTGQIGPGGKAPWKASSTSAIRVWQPEAYAHDLEHTDYSQASPQLVQRAVRVLTNDGDPLELDIADVAADDDLSFAISQSGPLTMTFPGLVGGTGPGPGGQGGGPGGGSARRSLVPVLGALGLGVGAIALGVHTNA
jgi:hypothetical protein